MLAVFDSAVAKAPEGLRCPGEEAGDNDAGGAGLVERFAAEKERSTIINFGPGAGSMAYSATKLNAPLPRLFAAVDDVFCLFQGHIENVPHLKQQYGLHKAATEVSIVIEAHKTLRDRGPYPPDHVARDFKGKYAFILFDNSSKTTFISADADRSLPFFWGTDIEGRLILSDDVDIVKHGCGKSFAPFPKGCFFTTSGGLRSFEYPLNELKPVPWVDSKGEVCGATYKVDEETKIETGIPRVGSAANWSTHY